MLTAALVATLLFALGLSSLGAWAVSESLAQSAEIARREERTAYLIGDIGRDVSWLRAHLREALPLSETTVATLDNARAISTHAKLGRRALPMLLGPQEQPLWEDLRPRLDRILGRFDRAITAIEEGRIEDAARLLDENAPDTMQLTDAIDGFQQVSLDDTEKAIDEVQARTAHTLKIVSMAKFALVAGVAFAWLLVLRIVAAQRRTLAVQIRRLEATNRDLEAFAGRVAHDMRNVLAPIQLGVSALRMGEADGRLQDIATRLDRSCARGRELVDGLLAFSRAADTEAHGPVGSADVGRELDDVLDQLDEAIVSAGVRVTRRIPPDTAVALPRPLLHAILLNLVDNAVKFMRGRPQRRLSIEAKPSARGYAMTIADTGPGIPENERTRVFDALYRGAAPRHEGTGLGLATAKRIVESHGGRIEIAVTGPHGTVFIVDLPRARPQTSTTSPGAAP